MPHPITICLVYFKSLALANLDCALYSVAQQDMTFVDSIIVVDNDTTDDAKDIESVIDAQHFTVPVSLVSIKHGDVTRTHSWSTNLAVSEVRTPWVFFTRADYLLDARMLKLCVEVAGAKPNLWDGFVTSYGYHLTTDIGGCERNTWRKDIRVLKALLGADIPYTMIDTGVWLARKDAFEHIGGLNEALSAWGHAQTDFQYRLHKAGTEFIVVQDTLFYHPQHAGLRDITAAHAQLQELAGADVRELWKRYEGVNPYASL